MRKPLGMLALLAGLLPSAQAADFQVKGPDGSITVWNLEGATPSALARDGWSAKSIKAGDELKMKVAPLRSGAPGGQWTPEGTKYRDGKAVLVTP